MKPADYISYNLLRSRDYNILIRAYMTTISYPGLGDYNMIPLVKRTTVLGSFDYKLESVYYQNMTTTYYYQDYKCDYKLFSRYSISIICYHNNISIRCYHNVNV